MDPKNLIQHIEGIAKLVEDYRKYDDATHYMLLVDKIKIILLTFRSLAIASHDDDIYRANLQVVANESTDEERALSITRIEEIKKQTCTVFDLLNDEIAGLQQFIMSRNTGPMQNIENKLDEVLLGPDYPLGQELMRKSQEDFNERMAKSPEFMQSSGGPLRHSTEVVNIELPRKRRGRLFRSRSSAKNLDHTL